jgi:NAD(P)-dependent dehydrogenase (short-subunit alcohol dehydrogenase family)
MSRTWLITGSSRGLGRALAEVVLADGGNVVATARDPARVADLVERHPRTARAVALDVTDRAQAEAAVRAAVEAFGRLDVVVDAVADSAEEDVRALCGAVNVTRAALGVLREQRVGHIVQVSPAGGRAAAPGAGPDPTSTWAIEGFSGVLAKEVGPLGIRVTLVEPGGVRTDQAGPSMTAARAILAVTQVEDPPLRLLLGADGRPEAGATAPAGPLVFIATNRLKPGKADAERRRVPDLVRFVEDHEPQLIAFNEYLSDDGSETTVVQVHPDAASMTKHLGIVAERAAAAYAETLDGTVTIQVYGSMDAKTLEAMRAQTGNGTTVTVASEHLGGFTRGR